MAADSVEGACLIKAFSAVPREPFIGPPPWQVVTQKGYVMIDGDDPTFLHQDFAVALQPDKHINNGQPSLHARCFAALKIKPGERVIHVGAGTGYYSALLAKIAGTNGSVLAYEVDPDLAEKAAKNLSDYSNVSVRNGSAAEGPLPECDVVYVSAGATGPMDAWLDCLRPGGRLVFPLTSTQGFGALLLVARNGEDTFAASFVCQAAFVHCMGARDDETAAKLTEAFKTGRILHPQRKGGMWDVKSLRRNKEPDGTCWFAGKGWWLSNEGVR